MSMQVLHKVGSVLVLLLFIITVNAQKPKVLVMGAAGQLLWLIEVQSKIQATNRFSKVDSFDLTNATPTLSLLNKYEAVLVFTDRPAQDANKTGDVLAQYIDKGGGVVSCVFEIASVSLGGLFDSPTYRVMNTGGQLQGISLSLGTINVPNHPIMKGVNTFNGGSSSYHSGTSTVTPGSVVVTEWSNGAPLVAVKEKVGKEKVRRVDLNFFPPSSNSRTDFWDANTDGALLMANSLCWLACLNVNTYASPVICHNGTNGSISLILTGCFPPFVYSWSNGDTTKDLINLGPGKYVITVTDSNGCEFKDSTTFANPPEIIYSAMITNEWYGLGNGKIDLTISGGYPPYIFAWSNAQITEDIDSLSPGVYSVTITDSIGCITMDTFTVGITGFNDANENRALLIYPNPVGEYIFIRNLPVKGARIEIISTHGRLLLDSPIVDKIFIGDLPSGTYFVKVYFDGQFNFVGRTFIKF